MADPELPSEDAPLLPDPFVAPAPAYVHVAPLDVDGVRSVEVGTILWGLAFVGLLPFWSSLEESGNLWWLWTCTTGLGLGLLGTEYCRRRRDRALEAARTPTGSMPVVVVEPERAAPVERRESGGRGPSPRSDRGGKRAGGRRRLE